MRKDRSSGQGENFNFLPSRLLENDLPKGKLTLLEKMIRILLKKVSKVVHFKDFFLYVCSVYSQFEFELRKIKPYLRCPKFTQQENLIIQLQLCLEGSFLW